MALTSLARLGYSTVTWAVQPFLRAKLRRRGAREPGYLYDLPARFGRYEPPPPLRPEQPPRGVPERRAQPRPVDGAGCAAAGT